VVNAFLFLLGLARENPMLLFKRGDLLVVLKGHADFVESFKQACTAEGLDLKICVKSIAARDLAFLQIDAQMEVSGGIASLQPDDL
jgi:hypothetical protein